MTVDATIGAAFDRVASRERDAMRAFTPGAAPENTDVVNGQTTAFTLDPLSVVPPGGDYLVVEGDRGTGRSYTRDGSLALRDGTLVDATGRPVFASAANGTLASVTIDPIDLALHRYENLHIESDGSVVYQRSVLDPRTGARVDERVVAGRLALARFPAGTQPGVQDAIHVGAPPGVTPHVGVAGDASFGSLTPMRRATSSIDVDASLDKLREAYIALDALRAARSADGTVAKTVMDLLK